MVLYLRKQSGNTNIFADCVGTLFTATGHKNTQALILFVLSCPHLWCRQWEISKQGSKEITRSVMWISGLTHDLFKESSREGCFHTMRRDLKKVCPLICTFSLLFLIRRQCTNDCNSDISCLLYITTFFVYIFFKNKTFCLFSFGLRLHYMCEEIRV